MALHLYRFGQHIGAHLTQKLFLLGKKQGSDSVVQGAGFRLRGTGWGGERLSVQGVVSSEW